MMDTLNMLVSFAASLACAYVVLNHRIDEGLCIKVGLALLSFGLGVTGLLLLLEVETWRGMRNAALLQRVGLLIAVVGYILKSRAKHHPMRRATDWGEMDTRPMERA